MLFYRERDVNARQRSLYFAFFSSGLCSVFRSRAGDLETLRKAVDEGRSEADPAAAPEAERLVSDREKDHAHNSHWLEDGKGGPSRFVAYYDAASLYPSSGKLQNLPDGSLPKASNEADPIFLS